MLRIFSSYKNVFLSHTSYEHFEFPTVRENICGSSDSHQLAADREEQESGLRLRRVRDGCVKRTECLILGSTLLVVTAFYVHVIILSPELS